MANTQWYRSLAADNNALLYLPNDPMTPELVAEISEPALPSPCPPFMVVGWAGTSGIPGTPQYQASQVYCTIATALRIVQSHLKTPMTKFFGTDKLVAFPRAGNAFNAYYDRVSLRFFYNADPKTRKVVFAAESPDVVSHELGHGILDTIRPDLWNTASLEIFAFHEAFGDIMAVCSAFEWPACCELVLRETHGDIAKPNCVSRIAQELGIALFRLTNGRKGYEDCLRNLANDYNYCAPDSLPANGPIIKESHSFSQIFSGTWYAALAEVYKTIMLDGGVKPVEALKKARDVMLHVLLDGTIHAIECHEFFQAVATSMLFSAAKYEGGRFADVIRSTFVRRNIHPKPPTLHLNSTSTIDDSVAGHKAHVDLDKPVLGHRRIVVHLPKFAQAVRPLMDEDSNRLCLSLSLEAVKYAQKHNLVGQPGDHKMYAIENGRFVRNYVCEGFCKSNI